MASLQSESVVESAVADRRQTVSGSIVRKEIRLEGTVHDIARLFEACKRVLRQAEEIGDLDRTFIVHAAAPQEDEQ